MKKTTFARRTSLWLTLMAITCAPLAAQTGPGFGSLKCEQETDPVGIETPSPRFSWQLVSPERGCRQTAYRIVVAGTEKDAAAGRATMWDSGKVPGEQSLLIPYNGQPLEAAETYYWSVRVWGPDGKPSAWSPAQRFTMGLPDREDWSGARWIALEEDVDSLIVINGTFDTGPDNPILGNKPFGRNKLPLLRREFTVDKPVRRATAYVCGLGQFELFLNGEKTGDHFLDPAWTKFDKEAQYVSFDVSHRLRQGANAVGAMLGNGFFNIPRERYSKFAGSYGAPKMIFKLQIEYEDGTRQTVVSDDSWKAAPGPVTFSSIYGGEDYDAGLAQAGWTSPDFDDSSWSAAVLTRFDSPLRSQRTTPIKIRQRVPTVRKYRNSKGNYLYDLGQNASGIVRLSVRASGRHTVRMFPGELCRPDSTVNQRSSGGPVFFSYTTRGDGSVESWQPQFTYYGFRYVEVEGAVPEGEPDRAAHDQLGRAGRHVRVLQPAFQSNLHVDRLGYPQQLFQRIHRLSPPRETRLARAVASDRPVDPIRLRYLAGLSENRRRHGDGPARGRNDSDHRAAVHRLRRRIPRHAGMGQRLHPAALLPLPLVRRRPADAREL